MKTTKIVLLFYSSILIIFLVTVGFLTNPYQDLTPTLLLLPVGFYFSLALVNQLTSFTKVLGHPNVGHARRALRNYSLIAILLLMFANLVASSSPLQSTLTLIFMPLVIFFSLDLSDRKIFKRFRLEKIIALNKLFGSKNKIDIKNDEKEQNMSEPEYLESEDSMIVGDHEPEKREVEGELMGDEFADLIDVKDKKRRQFLKIVGGGGVSMFLMLFVFQQKASAAFFGSAPGPGVVGVKDIAGDKIDPAEKQPTDGYNISEVDDDSSPAYYGFIHKDGAWYIAKEDSAGAYRYVSGASSFSTNWTDRASLTYDYFDNIF